MQMAYYQDQKFKIHPEVYTPAEDSFLLADNLDMQKDEKVLEIGTGCGLLAILAAQEGAEVLATDINPKAIKCAEENTKAHEVQGKTEFKLGDLFEPAKGEKFDLIVFNPPYLPVPASEKQNSELGKAWDGGPDGRKIIDRFLDKVENYLKPEGRFIFVQSSLSNAPKTLNKLEKKNFEVQTKIKKFSFEELYLIKANPKNNG